MVPASPTARARRLAARRLLDLLVLATLLAHAAARAAQRAGHPRCAPLPPPLEVDLGAAPLERLVLLPGIGRSRAEAILRDRARRGPLPSLDALVRVDGIGPGTVAALASTDAIHAVVSPAASPPPPERARGSPAPSPASERAPP